MRKLHRLTVQIYFSKLHAAQIEFSASSNETSFQRDLEVVAMPPTYFMVFTESSVMDKLMFFGVSQISSHYVLKDNP